MAHGPDTDRLLYRIQNIVKNPNKSRCSLEIQNLDIWSLPKLPHGITHLYCYNTQLREIYHLPATIKYLNCKNTPLTHLGALPNGLKELHCDSTNLRSLPELPASLVYLDCSLSDIREIPTLPLKLQSFFCARNKRLTYLPELPDSLTQIDFSYTDVSEIGYLPPNLTYMNCDNTKLTVLPEFPLGLRWLHSHSNSLILSRLTNETICDYGKRWSQWNEAKRSHDRNAIIKEDLIQTLWNPDKMICV